METLGLSGFSLLGVGMQDILVCCSLVLVSPNLSISSYHPSEFSVGCLLYHFQVLYLTLARRSKEKFHSAHTRSLPFFVIICSIQLA